jgi:replication fork clamp-binding protein CrfC
MQIDPLSARVTEVCDDILDWVDEPARPVLRGLIRQLQQPLSVAVVGAVKAGKSTLVNALIGRRIAPTAATECTRVVTWYRHGLAAKIRGDVVHAKLEAVGFEGVEIDPHTRPHVNNAAVCEALGRQQAETMATAV